MKKLILILAIVSSAFAHYYQPVVNYHTNATIDGSDAFTSLNWQIYKENACDRILAHPEDNPKTLGYACAKYYTYRDQYDTFAEKLKPFDIVTPLFNAIKDGNNPIGSFFRRNAEMNLYSHPLFLNSYLYAPVYLGRGGVNSFQFDIDDLRSGKLNFPLNREYVVESPLVPDEVSLLFINFLAMGVLLGCYLAFKTIFFKFLFSESV